MAATATEQKRTWVLSVKADTARFSESRWVYFYHICIHKHERTELARFAYGLFDSIPVGPLLLSALERKNECSQGQSRL